MSPFLEPVKLSGEGVYALSGFKEIDVTHYFLGLKQNVRGCQIYEEFINCTSNLNSRTFLNKCGCLPFNIRTKV